MGYPNQDLPAVLLSAKFKSKKEMPKTFTPLLLYTGENDLTGPSSAFMPMYRTDMHLCPDGDECLTVFALLAATPVALRTRGWKDTQDRPGPSRAPPFTSARSPPVRRVWAGPRFQDWVCIFTPKSSSLREPGLSRGQEQSRMDPICGEGCSAWSGILLLNLFFQCGPNKGMAQPQTFQTCLKL